MKARRNKAERSGTIGTLVSPYYDWAQATNFAYYGERELIPVIIELRGITAQQFAQGRWDPPGEPGEWKTWIQLPWVYAHPPAGVENVKFCSAVVTPEFFRQLKVKTSTLRRVIRRFELGDPIGNFPRNAARRALPKSLALKSGATNGLVVTGIIDDGLAFAHKRFRRRKKTRIHYFWYQDGLPVPGQLPGYGREIFKRDQSTPTGTLRGIDRLMSDCTHAGVVDEDEVYQLSGFIDHSLPAHKSAALRSAHGTHVMDAACGDDPAGAPGDRPIVCVQLMCRAVEDTSGAGLRPQVIEGLHYILARADSIAAQNNCGPLPVVINLSYGIFAGPHDGTDILEAAIDDLIRTRNAALNPPPQVLPLKIPLAVVLPSGNSRLSRCHARFSLAVASTRTLHWRVQPEDRTESLLEIWLPHTVGGGIPPRVEVRVESPAGDVTLWIGEGAGSNLLWGADVVGRVDYYTPAATGNRAMIRIAMAPTSALDPTLKIAPSGTWNVHLRNAVAVRVRNVHAWIQRDDTPHGYPRRGRQSRFDDRAYLYRDDAGREIEADSAASYIKRDDSISAFATSRRTTVMGGFRRSDFSVWKQSAGGPIVKPAGAPKAPRDGPDALAVSEDSPACHGVLAAGSRSGSTVAMNGTSVAAPQITRWIAGEMGANPPRPSNRWAVQAEARRQETTPPPRPNPPPPPQRGGAGRIELRPVVKVERFEK